MTTYGSEQQAAVTNGYQRDYWAVEGPQLYARHGERWQRMAAPYGTAILEAAALRPGERVLDVGCGHGASTMAAAEHVAPGGSVVGVDISAAMLQPARLAAAGVDNVEFVQADAQVHPFAADAFDVVISQFGTMFFQDPRAAFANLRRALRPGGRMAWVCWQEPLRTGWIAVSMGVAVPLLGRPPELGEPGAPGPYALADGDRLRDLVTAAGFESVSLDAVTRPQLVGDDVDDTVGFVMSLPETQQLFAGAPAETLTAATAALRDAFAPHAGPRGVILDATAWLVTARR